MWSVAPPAGSAGTRSCRGRRAPRRLELPGDQLVVAEQMLDDPEIEGPGDRLGVLEPVLEFAVARDVRRSSKLRQQVELTGDLVVGPDQTNPASMWSPRARRRRRPPGRVEGQVPPGERAFSAAWMTGSPAWKSIGAPASVRVLIRSGAGRRRSPPTTRPGSRRSGSPPAAVVDRPVNHFQVILDSRILGLRWRRSSRA